MKLYVSIDDNKNIATISKFYGDYEISQETLTVDFSKLEGYSLKLDTETNTYELVFDEDKYNKFINKATREESIQQAEQLRDQLIKDTVLGNATDEQAYIMRYLYPEWLGDGLEYKKDDRFIYEDKFYKVLQDHTSQSDWTPDTASSLYVEIADPSNEYPEFKQPTGAHDAYAKGDKVTFEGKHYISLIDANTYSPTDYPAGWQLAE